MRLIRLVTMGALLAGCASADKPAGGGGGGTATREVAAGAQRLRGGGITMDVSVGRGPLTRPVAGAGTTARPHAAVTP